MPILMFSKDGHYVGLKLEAVCLGCLSFSQQCWSSIQS